MCVVLLTRASSYFVLFLCYFVCSVSCTSARDWLERLISEMTYNVLMGTLNPTHSPTHSLTYPLTHHSHSLTHLHILGFQLLPLPLHHFLLKQNPKWSQMAHSAAKVDQIVAVTSLVQWWSILPIGALTLLVGRQEGIWPTKSWMFLWWWWRFPCSFARLAVITTTSIILSSSRTG